MIEINEYDLDKMLYDAHGNYWNEHGESPRYIMVSDPVAEAIVKHKTNTDYFCDIPIIRVSSSKVFATATKQYKFWTEPLSTDILSQYEKVNMVKVFEKHTILEKHVTQARAAFIGRFKRDLAYSAINMLAQEGFMSSEYTFKYIYLAGADRIPEYYEERYKLSLYVFVIKSDTHPDFVPVEQLTIVRKDDFQWK